VISELLDWKRFWDVQLWEFAFLVLFCLIIKDSTFSWSWSKQKQYGNTKKYNILLLPNDFLIFYLRYWALLWAILKCCATDPFNVGVLQNKQGALESDHRGAGLQRPQDVHGDELTTFWRPYSQLQGGQAKVSFYLRLLQLKSHEKDIKVGNPDEDMNIFIYSIDSVSKFQETLLRCLFFAVLRIRNFYFGSGFGSGSGL